MQGMVIPMHVAGARIGRVVRVKARHVCTRVDPVRLARLERRYVNERSLSIAVDRLLARLLASP